jgi:hypothetical protein
MTNDSAQPEPLTMEELSSFLELSLECAERACANGLRFDFYDPRHRYSILILRAVLDYARGIVALNRAARYSGVAPITRSALDAYTDIANLGDHPDYWQHLAAADASSWKQLLERASHGKNPVLRAFSRDELFPIGRRHTAQELKALEARGIDKLGISERFQQAGLTHEYESVYAILSAEMHNNVSSLQSRYIDWDESRAWVVAPGETSRHSHHYEDACTLTMSEIVIQSTEKVLTLLRHGTAVMSPARSQLEQIWKRAQTEESSGARVASSEKLQSIKRASQSRDRKLVAKEGAVDEMFLIGPDLAKNAKVDWPDVDLIDEHAPYAPQERSKF